MTALRRRRPIDIWPAFVDATASLLMVVIFVLLVAAVGQQFLTEAILGRDEALGRLNARVNELADMLSMEQSESARLVSELALRTASLEQAEALAAARGETMADQAEELEQRAGVIDEQSRQLVEFERRRAVLANELEALQALRDRVEAELENVIAERDEVRARLTAETALNVTAQAQIELLNRQLGEVRTQLAELSAAIDAADSELAVRDARIEELGARLNVALASKTAQLQRYRSEFFGRLREALADVPGIEIVGDRFVLPSELLFESGSDALGPVGRRQVAQVAATLDRLVERIPPELDWVLRIDGHTDRRPIATARFPSNWELSAARAIRIVRELVGFGIPADRLAATGFAEHHPLDAGDSAEALARNRRIEIKLTSR